MRFALKAGMLALPLAFGLVASATGFERSANSAGSRSVKAKDIDFSPAKISIRRGMVVSWRFLDSTRHNVTSRGKRRFRSSKDLRSGTHKVRFRKAGRYSYVCTFHPLSMQGVVVVR